MKNRLFLSALIVAFAAFIQYQVGLNDYVALAWLIFSAYLMKVVILEFHMGGRQLLSNHFKNNGNARKILRKPGIFAHGISFIVALFVAFGLFLLLKGISITHGNIPILVIIGITTIMVYPWLVPPSHGEALGDGSDTKVLKDRELKDTTLKYADFVSRLALMIIFLNLVLAFALSARDTMVFLVSSIDMTNFNVYAHDHAVDSREYNHFTRIVINAYVLAESFKLALANLIYNALMTDAEKVRYFYVFYFTTFLMNLIKLTPISIGLVVLLRGIRFRSDALQYMFYMYIGKIRSKFPGKDSYSNLDGLVLVGYRNDIIRKIPYINR